MKPDPEQLRTIQGIVFDSDGVLTDGGVYVGADGTEFRRFNIQDGAGLVALLKAGIRLAVVSSSACECVLHRARQLGIEEAYVGITSKVETIDEILDRWQLNWSQIAYVGDDWVDVGPMQRCGLPIAVGNAVSDVKAVSRWTTLRDGGQGAVREIAEALLACRESRPELGSVPSH